MPADILLVEDNPDDAELTVRALRGQGLVDRLHHARDGVEALDYLFSAGATPTADRRRLPKVILLDLKLPRVDGLEVLERVRAEPRTREIPVVVMTSSREDRDLARAYELGASSFVVKPVKFDDFMDVVTKLGIYWLLVNVPPPEGASPR